MKLTYNDVRYIISEATKRIISEQYGSNKKSRIISINIDDVADESWDVFEDEIEVLYDKLNGEDAYIQLRCIFDYDEGQDGDGWFTEKINPSCTLYDMTPIDNDFLKGELSPEAYNAILTSVKKYVWKNHDDYEMEMEDEIEKENDSREMDYWDDEFDRRREEKYFGKN